MQILDATNESMYQMINPKRVYNDFFDIPYKIIQTLLFIENRHLLSDIYPQYQSRCRLGTFWQSARFPGRRIRQYQYAVDGGQHSGNPD